MNGNGTFTAIDWATMPDWISVTECSEQTGYHPDHLRRLLRSGKIKAVHKGNMWWVDRDSLRDYVVEMESLGPKKFDPRGLPQLASE